MHTTYLLALAAASIVTAKPAPKPTVANFDNIPVIPAAPLLNTIDKYKGLSYQGWLVNDGSLAELGVRPPSLPNAINHNVVLNPQDVDFGFSVAGTNTKSFDLHSVAVSCALDLQNDAAATAAPCTLLFQGFDDLHSKHPVAHQLVTYTAQKPKSNPIFKEFTKIKFSDKFQGLKKINIVQIESLGGPITNSVVLDNVVYTLHH